MSLADSVRSYARRYPLVGPLAWIASLQYFITQPIVAWAWTPQYSWSDNVISNLGNTGCQQMVLATCSPLAPLMNTSFIVLGLGMLAGAALLHYGRAESFGRLVGFGMIGLGGVGTVLVGLFPENTNGLMHGLGAILALGVANLGLILLALVLGERPFWLRVSAFMVGLIALVALVMFALGYHQPLGAGTLERIVSYPYVLWLIVYGCYELWRLRK